MESIDFKQSNADPCIFIKTEESEKIIVAVYAPRQMKRWKK